MISILNLSCATLPRIVLFTSICTEMIDRVHEHQHNNPWRNWSHHNFCQACWRIKVFMNTEDFSIVLTILDNQKRIEKWPYLKEMVFQIWLKNQQTWNRRNPHPKGKRNPDHKTELRSSLNELKNQACNDWGIQNPEPSSMVVQK